jgi:hypothetical protein
MPVHEERVNSDNPKTGGESNSLDKQIEDIKKKQEIEALQAKFKTADEFLKATEKLETKEKELNQKEAQLNLEKTALDAGKLKLESEEAQAKATIANESKRIQDIGKEYNAKWKAEDDKRKQEQKLVIKYMDELAADVYNLHPQYISSVAKERISKSLMPLLKAYGISPMFNRNNEYVPLSSRADMLGSKEIKEERTNNVAVGENMVDNAKKAKQICVDFYYYIQKEPNHGLPFANWCYKELKILNGLLDGQQTDKQILPNMSIIMEHFGAINQSLITLATKYEGANNPNYGSSELTNYICKVSERIEQLLGVTVSDGE